MNAEQVARNDAIYREANERIESAAAEYAVSGRIPFICECAEPTHFLNLPGHDQLAREHVEVVRRHPDYFVVEKQGRAAQIVEDLDPRQASRG